MALYNSDVLIRELRKQKGLTLKQLSEGVCSLDTLSKIERGERTPDKYIFDRVMNKLGESPSRYRNDILTTAEKEIEDIKDKLIYLTQRGKYEEAEELLYSIENREEFKYGFNLQFVLSRKALIAVGHKNLNEIYKYGIEGIKITKPNFVEDNIDKYLYTYEEIGLINSIAIYYHKIGNIEQYLEILTKLKVSLDKNYLNLKEKSKTYTQLLFNLTNGKIHLKQYDNNLLELCDKGIELCEMYDKHYYYPYFIISKALFFLYTDNLSEGNRLYKKAILMLESYDRKIELENTINFLKSEFNIDYTDL